MMGASGCVDSSPHRHAPALDDLVGEREQLVWNRDAPSPAGVPSDGASERHQGAPLLGSEAIEQPVAAGAARLPQMYLDQSTFPEL